MTHLNERPSLTADTDTKTNPPLLYSHTPPKKSQSTQIPNLLQQPFRNFCYFQYNRRNRECMRNCGWKAPTRGGCGSGSAIQTPGIRFPSRRRNAAPHHIGHRRRDARPLSLAPSLGWGYHYSAASSVSPLLICACRLYGTK